MKHKIELVSVTVKIDDIEKTFTKEKCEFQGWEQGGDGFWIGDSGVDLTLTDGKKKYKMSVD